MITYEETLKNLVENSSIVKNRNLSREDVESFLKDYQKEFTNTLLKYGRVVLSEDIQLEIVTLQKRVHVLRGQSYHNWRKYKLKAHTTYDYYLKIEKAFAELLEDHPHEG